MAIVTIKPVTVHELTNFSSTGGAGTEVAVVTDAVLSTYVYPAFVNDYITYDCEDPGGDDSAPVTDVTIRARLNCSANSSDAKLRCKLNGIVTQSPSINFGPGGAWFTWSVARPGGGGWILKDVKDAKFGATAINWITDWTMPELEVQVTYEKRPGQSEAERDKMTRALNARNQGGVAIVINVPLRYGLDKELFGTVNLSHFGAPDPLRTTTGRRVGYGRETWERGILRVTRRTIRTSDFSVDWECDDIRRRLYTLRMSGRAIRTLSDLRDGVAIASRGGALSFTRASDAWAQHPGDGLIYRVGADFGRFLAAGYLGESGRTNRVLRSSFISQLTGLPASSGSGTRTAEQAPPQPYFSPGVSDYALLFTAGSPHSSDGGQPWPATASLSANTVVCLWFVHLDASSQVGWRLQRGIDSWWWNDSTAAWQSGQVTNLAPLATTRGVAVSKPINVGGSATTLTPTLVQPSEGTDGRKDRVYHLQVEDGPWPTSPIVTDAATYTRAADLLWIENNAGKRSLYRPRWSFRGKFIPGWNGADVPSGTKLVFWSARYDASNLYRLYYDGGAQAVTLDAVVAGTAYTASKAWVPVRGTAYRIGARATSGLGELLLPARSLSVFVDGVKGTDATRPDDPREVDDADLYLGGDVVDQPCNGLLYDLVWTPIPLGDSEMAETRY
jgi:hypothetical protein